MVLLILLSTLYDHLLSHLLQFNVRVVTQIVNMSDASLGQLPLQKSH
jgi:hypothetical protein